MENPWLNGDAPADIWSDGGLSTNDTYTGECCCFGCEAPVPWSEYQKLQQSLGETYEQLFKVCEALTEVCNLARFHVPEFYKDVCARFVEGDDVRPEDFLEKEYGKPPK